ncbi:hypothetical protein JCM12296A_34630 [Desulfosarcina cetonica]
MGMPATKGRQAAVSLPNNTNAEESLIVAMMLDPDVIAAVRDLVDPGDFYRSRHQPIVRAIYDRHGNDLSCDLMGMGLSLDGEAAYLAGLIDKVPGASSIQTAVEAAEKIAADARARRLAAGISQINQRLFDPSANKDDVVKFARDTIDAVIADATKDNAWPDPLPLVADERPAPYPMDALIGMIGDAVREVTEFVQCPAALAVGSAVAAISTVAAGLVDVRRDEGLQGPVGIAVICIADSGERKSSADSYFTGPIRDWELSVADEMAHEIQAWQADDTAWRAKRDGIVNAIRSAAQHDDETSELEDRLAEHEARQPERPRVPRLLIGDATTEALTWRLAHVWSVAGVLSSEAGIVFGGHAMGRETIMRNLSTLNTLWDGAPLHIDRRTTDSYTVPAARITLGLAVQPQTIQRFVDGSQGLARSIGFLARFLIAWPESTQGTRMYRPAPKGWPALNRFHDRLRVLLDFPVPFDDAGKLTPTVLDLSPDAKKLWIRFHDDIERELADTGELGDVRDVGSKAADNAARLAALFHVFDHGPQGEVGQEHMQAAARIVTWHVFEARRFLRRVSSETEGQGDAVMLDAWLIDRCQQDGVISIPISTIQKSGPNRLRKKAALNAALAELEDANRFKLTTAGKKKIVKINPKLLEVADGAA